MTAILEYKTMILKGCEICNISCCDAIVEDNRQSIWKIELYLILVHISVLRIAPVFAYNNHGFSFV